MLPKKILVIDDERIVRYTTCVLLAKQGIDAIAAETGNEGIELARSESPDLILLDLILPDMTGWVVLDRLRADTQTASVPVVVFSAGDYAETVARAKQEGISHVLRKPFQLNQLLEACTLSE